MVWAALIGVAATWLGVLLAYDSFYWPPARHGWPVSFFVVTLIFLGYVLVRPPARPGTRRAAGAQPEAADGAQLEARGRAQPAPRSARLTAQSAPGPGPG